MTDHNPALPTGTVTFMFTDIEGSTRLAQRLGDERFSRVVDRHHALVRRILDENDGVEVATEGDSFFAVFPATPDAVAAAADLQRSVAKEQWPEGVELAVRLGLHTGSAVLGGDNYVGVDVHRAARISAAAHGGQAMTSGVTAQLVGSHLPGGVDLEKLGKYRLADLPGAEELYQLVIDGLRSDFPPPDGVEGLSKLPVVLTDFVGRDGELETGASMLREHRLVTLTGPGGTGKTRLSIELARRVDGEFADGCYFVPLAPINEIDLIPTAILGELGLTTAGTVSPQEHLVRFLRDRETLLVLDNFEQLIEGAPIVSFLLGQAPGLKMLITSRTPLHVMGERELPVPPLPVPSGPEVSVDEIDRWAGVQLFARRAAAVRPNFELSPGNVTTITAIATRLDGLPLAIELAASRMRTLTPELILQRLDNRLLSGAAPDRPARQQTIVDAIGWSYDLLDEPRRRLFEHASVFSGSFGLVEGEAVCGLEDSDMDVLDGLVALVENSLLQQTETSGAPRFRMLTVIREYGYAALSARGEEAALLERHARTYLELAERAEQEILTSAQGEWLSRLTADHDNLRAAFDWAVGRGDASTAQRLVGALWRFWQIRGHLREGRQRAEAALALESDDPWAKARALTALAGIRYWQGDQAGTLPEYSEALELYRQIGNEEEIAEALYNMAFPAAYAADYQRAEELVQESLTISERIGRQIGVGRAYWALGNFAGFREEYDSVFRLSLRAAEELETLDAPYDLGWAWFMVAFGHLRQGNDVQARDYLVRAIEIFAGVKDVSALTLLFANMGVVALRMGDEVAAAKLGGAADRLTADIGVAISEVDMNQFPEFMEFINAGDEVVQAAYAEGRALGLEEAIELATTVEGP